MVDQGSMLITLATLAMASEIRFESVIFQVTRQPGECNIDLEYIKPCFKIPLCVYYLIIELVQNSLFVTHLVAATNTKEINDVLQHVMKEVSDLASKLDDIVSRLVILESKSMIEQVGASRKGTYLGI